MDNEKVKRNRNAYKAFVQITIESATRISSSKNWITTQEQNNGQQKANPHRAFVQKTPQTKIQKENNQILISDLP